MATKKITDLQLISALTGSENFPVDDGIETYRSTINQIKAYILAERKPPKISILTGSSGTFTPQADTLYMKIRGTAPGGAGAGDTAGPAGDGTNSTFGSSFITLHAGKGGSTGGARGGLGGTGGSLPANTTGHFINGEDGQGSQNIIHAAGGEGGASAMFGIGGAGAGDGGNAIDPQAGTGTGGGGGGATTGTASGSGGGGGEYCEVWVGVLSGSTIASSYSYTNGTGGAMEGTTTFGANGATGQWEITEYFF